MKFNITKKELESAIIYAEKFGKSEFKTISMEIIRDNGIGETIRLTTISDVDKAGIDITEIDSW